MELQNGQVTYADLTANNCWHQNLNGAVPFHLYTSQYTWPLPAVHTRATVEHREGALSVEQRGSGSWAPYVSEDLLPK